MSSARAKPQMTRKHLARAQRDRILSRWILGGTIAVMITVLGLLAFAFFGVEIIENRQAIATINGEVVSVREFKARVRLIQLSMINEYQYAQTIVQVYAAEPSISSYYQQRIDQLASELNNPALQGQQALDGLINEILVRQEANARGIFVTREEIDRTIAERDFGYFAEGTPTPQPSPTADLSASPTVTPSATPTEEVPSTPTATAAPATITATPSSSPTPQPTATPYTEEGFLASYAKQMDFFMEAGIREEDYLAVIESELYLEKLMEALEQDLAREEDQVWLRHIQVLEADEGRSVLERLAGGEIWEDLAAELSLDELTKDDGGDLGWLSSQELNADYGSAFAILAFAAAIDETSGPVQSESGWHVIQILGHEFRTLSDFEFDQRLQAAYDDLLAELEAQGEIESDENWPDYVPDASNLARQVLE